MKYKLDPVVVAEIKSIVRETIWEVLECSDEKYVTPKELASQISFLPLAWIQKNWELLPRESAIVEMPDGRKVESNPGYPLHKIQRMIADGKFRNLKKLEKGDKRHVGCTEVQ